MLSSFDSVAGHPNKQLLSRKMNFRELTASEAVNNSDPVNLKCNVNLFMMKS